MAERISHISKIWGTLLKLPGYSHVHLNDIQRGLLTFHCMPPPIPSLSLFPFLAFLPPAFSPSPKLWNTQEKRGAYGPFSSVPSCIPSRTVIFSQNTLFLKWEWIEVCRVEPWLFLISFISEGQSGQAGNSGLRGSATQLVRTLLIDLDQTMYTHNTI